MLLFQKRKTTIKRKIKKIQIFTIIQRKEEKNMCIFCKIIQGEIPSYKIYEDENTLAILDISQATIGHTLVLPKKHYENILEIPTNEYLNVMNTVQKITKKEKETLLVQGFNILNNCNEIAGQTIMHFHIHILPRYENDDLKIQFKNHEKDYDLKKIQEAILK